MTTVATNPLLSFEGLPPFSIIKPEYIVEAIKTTLDENRARLHDLLEKHKDDAQWENLILPLELDDDKLSRRWSPVSHMNSVVNTEALREAYTACLPLLSDYSVEMGQNRQLYEAYQTIADSDDWEKLSAAQRKTIEDGLMNFRLSGVDLPKDKQESFAKISQALSKLQSKFSDNVLDATNHWQKAITDEAQLAGLPEGEKAMLKAAAEARDLEGWLITLEIPSYLAIVTYAENRDLRHEVYRAYACRASDLGEKEDWDNTAIIEEILKLRQEKAELLGFEDYVALSLARKMAASFDQVNDFLLELGHKARPFAEQELEELKHLAAEKLGIDDFQAWDFAYTSEKLKEEKFAINDEMLKPYFSVEHVLQGLFSLTEKLFSLKITRKEGIDTWHPDVRFYQIYDTNKQLRGEFYLDLYARAHKRGGAWMDEYRGRFLKPEGLQTPVAYLTCNSSAPVGDKPALFTHDQMVTLFHEFGHGIHHMLTQIDYPAVSGINGVEWDAVELPSQFMENWCWEKSVLDQFAHHYKSGDVMPEALFAQLRKSRDFQAGMMMLRQLEFALFDLYLHHDKESSKPGRVAEILNQVRDDIAVFKPPAFNRFQHGFSHIFAGGYAAGYFSYKWAEVLSADAFARFEEEGLFNDGTGKAYLNEILEVGGSRPAMDSFKAFRGREPDVTALLRHNGLLADV